MLYHASYLLQFQVSPSELENVLLQLEGVTDCAVIGVSHSEFEEVPVAFVVTSPEIDNYEAKIHMFVNGRKIRFRLQT